MKTKKLDIVYFLKEGPSEELRYSLRSLKNFPHAKVWLYGSKPKWVTNVNFVPAEQTGTKWQNTSMMYEMVCKNPDITEDFVIFNDDFFILEPIKDLFYYYEGDLEARAEKTKKAKTMWQTPNYSRYGLLLKETNQWLLDHGYDNKNYELHIPMVFNREKMLECLKAFPEGGYAARRSLYANINKVRSRERVDCKVYSMTRFPAKGIKEFVSTTDQSFQRGSVGYWLKRYFTEKSEYEI